MTEQMRSKTIVVGLDEATVGAIPLACLFRTLHGTPRYVRNYGPLMMVRIIVDRLIPVER
jgi:hypothetical protein